MPASQSSLVHETLDQVPGYEPLVAEDIEDPRFELLGPLARAAATSLVRLHDQGDRRAAREVIAHVDASSAERDYLMGEVGFEFDDPECAQAFSRAARASGLPQPLRARSWIMAVRCAGLDGDGAVRPVLDAALGSGLLSREHANLLIDRLERQGFESNRAYANARRGLVARAMRVTSRWERTGYGIAVVSFQVNDRGDILDLDILASSPGQEPGARARDMLQGRAMGDLGLPDEGRLMLTVILGP